MILGKRIGFSLVEILVALIIVSVIMAALAPVITKKLTSAGITIVGGGSGGGSGGGETPEPSGCGIGAYMPTGETVCRACAQVTANCEACADGEGICTKCYNGFTLTADKKCKKNDPCGDKAMLVKIDGEDYCFTKYNVGNATTNSKEIPYPASANVTMEKAGTSGEGAKSCSGKCCWYSTITKNFDEYEEYPVNTRTVCNWEGASALCDNLVYNGYDDWRLPTKNEFASLDLIALSSGKGENGLMLCNNTSGTALPYCASATRCLGASDNKCNAYEMWASVKPNRVYITQSPPKQIAANDNYNFAQSTRCIRKIKSNEGATACEPGTFLSGSTCIPCTNKTANCKTCNNENGTCNVCADGYELKDNKCSWTGCGEKALKINISGVDYCFTKYNVGNVATNSAEIAMPSDVVKLHKAGTTGEGATSCSGKCCWYDITSKTCDAANKSYNACTRTVCNWEGSSMLCDNLVYNGYDDWRLPTENELANIDFIGLTKGKNTEGLMMCDNYSGYDIPQCATIERCLGASENRCNPYELWSNVKPNRIYISTGKKNTASDNYNFAQSTRCIRRMDGTESTSQCSLGYYQKTAGTCEACSSKTAHCKTCNTLDGICLVCEDGYQLNGDTCIISGCGAKALRVTIAGEDYCITKYNLGNPLVNEKEIQIPTSAVNLKDVSVSCSGKCCWTGNTSATCDKYDKNYNACTRTVCNWEGASAACDSLIYNGHNDWRLPTLSELTSLDLIGLTFNKGTEGLMLCDAAQSTTMTTCKSQEVCKGASDNKCNPYELWASVKPNRVYITSGSVKTADSNYNYALSVRCIRKIGADEVATECPIGTYMEGADCMACSSKTTYCKNCNAVTGACTVCEDGYELDGSGSCVWTGCGTKAVKIIIDNEPYCFTKYNVGNSTYNELEIPYPTNASITMEKAGTSGEGAKSCSGKCCWWGETSKTCDSGTDYSGCTRTVCNFEGAKAACENLDYMGYTDWVLPTVNQFASMDLYSLTVGKSTSGLLLCDNAASTGMSQCKAVERCLGASDHRCNAYEMWASVKPNRVYMSSGVQKTASDNYNFGLSVRCIRKLTTN